MTVSDDVAFYPVDFFCRRFMTNATVHPLSRFNLCHPNHDKHA